MDHDDEHLAINLVHRLILHRRPNEGKLSDVKKYRVHGNRKALIRLARRVQKPRPNPELAAVRAAMNSSLVAFRLLKSGEGM
jgi:hypothetical protein